MKKQRRIIGVIASLVEVGTQADMMKGICEIAFAHNYDVLVFSMSVKQHARMLYQTGEINIYNLINYELLDGIIIIPDTIRIPGLVEHITSEIKEKFSGPVISLDYRVDGFMNLEFDDVKSMEILTDHLIDTHHYMNVACMTGPKEHPHAIRRLQGYINSLEKHGIEVKEEQIYYGDFWYNEGKRVAEHMLHILPKLPDALICTCDVMAISVINALKEQNIYVPDDIAVVGFDAHSSGLYFKPSITSMRHNSKLLGKYAMTHMIEALDQIPFTTLQEDTANLLLQESCGCEHTDEYVDYQKLCFLDDDYTDSFYSVYNFMFEELVSADTLQVLSERMCEHTFQLNQFDNFYLALCDNWDYVGFSEETARNYNTKSYTNKMHLQVVKKENTNIYNKEVFPSSIMLPEIWADREKPAVFYFNPVHFNDRCFGYVVTSYTTPNTISNIHRDWLRMVGIALENLRVKNNFRYSNEQLEEYAQIDSLTKIYNRNAYAKYSNSFFTKALQGQKELLILMGDLNNLKHINDTFGHIEGDNAIQLCALAFQRVCSANEKCFRYGGDEFILFGAGNYTSLQAKHLVKEIHSYLDQYNESNDKPYDITISVGFWCGQIEEDHDLDYYIKLTDSSMFDMKQKYKREHPNIVVSAK
ncbi:MAG: GGDEF domain-containing protein [Clostridiales bacterium]|nr:GGDEF domain-containing protein [Clostridiales bacterium]